jgi:AcrR family transcriptional regulator
VTSQEPVAEAAGTKGRRPRGVVRDGLVTAGVELARPGGPDAVVLREAARMVGVVPNAAYRHFADRDELLAAVCTVAMRELAARMAAGTRRVRGQYGDAAAARRRLQAIAALDELVDAGVLIRRRRAGIEYPIWSTVHGLAVLTGQGPLRDEPDAVRLRIEKVTNSFIEAGLT